jgi:hypothetical protein
MEALDDNSQENSGLENSALENSAPENSALDDSIEECMAPALALALVTRKRAGRLAAIRAGRLIATMMVWTRSKSKRVH